MKKAREVNGFAASEMLKRRFLMGSYLKLILNVQMEVNEFDQGSDPAVEQRA